MPSRPATELIKEAEEKKKVYLWSEAARLFEEAAAASLSGGEKAHFMESCGHCESRASQQATDHMIFTERRKAAVRAYTKASQLYDHSEGRKGTAVGNECRMLASYNGAWLTQSAAEKKKALGECVNLGKESAASYHRVGDKLGCARVSMNILRCLFEMLYVAVNSKEMAETAKSGIEYAHQAIDALATLDRKELLLEAYSLASLQSWYAANINEEPEESEGLSKLSIDFSEKARKLSTTLDDPYLGALSNWAAAIATLFFTENAESSFDYAVKMNEQARLAKDRYLVGVSDYVLAQVSDWTAKREADSNKMKEWLNAVIKYAKEAIEYLEPVTQDFYAAQVRHLYAESLASLARGAEMDSIEKRAILEKAVDIGRAGVNSAKRSGSPDAMGATLHALSKTLQFYSNFESGKNAKTALLEEALLRRESFNEISARAFPSNDWVVGVGKNYAGLIKRDLAELDVNQDRKKARLESAVTDMREGILRCRKLTMQRSIPTLVMTTANFEQTLGDVLNQLFRITGDEPLLRGSIEIDQNAADDFDRIKAPNRSAECYWRIAMKHNCLGDHGSASASFAKAFGKYEEAATLMSDFSQFYFDYAAYMNAWSEIEKATAAHEQEQYSKAVSHFQKVSSILEGSKLWSYFAPNFRAWSLLEQGEALSRNEKTSESLRAFRKGAELFEKARKTFEKIVDKIKDPDESQKAIELRKACSQRANYCLAREWIEAAKSDDRNGKHADSADKYNSAASILEKMLEGAQTDIERKEIAPYACMVRAWERMKMADARASAQLYLQASQLFSDAKARGLEETQTLLASGNSAICKALEHGTLFEETREKTEFSKAKKYLESASSFYLKAGLENASAWTTATELLLDAYNYLTDAETEDNLANRSRMLMLAEKCLEQSARLYEAANYAGRRDEALRIIEKVKEKREFAVSLGNLLTTPDEASDTKAIPAPKPTIEVPVGLQKFEHEYIQANLSSAKTDVLAAEDFCLEVHVANLGKTPAFVSRIEDLVPGGIELADDNGSFNIENHGLDTKGKKLDPTKSETFRIGIRSLDKGSYEIRPRIICVDETGQQVLCDPEPLTINVTETILPNRVPTGHRCLDLLLLGGIPEKFAVLLTSPSSDERSTLIYDFLESGTRKDETTFCVTVDIRGKERLTEISGTSFRLFICNPKADEMIKDMPNVCKLKGIENLTEISIALTSALRNLSPAKRGPRRLCLEIISDVLLHHHAVLTRRWLTSIIPELRSHEFTTLAVLNPQMHSAQEVQAILDIFDGEISIFEKETGKSPQKSLIVRRLSSQRYLSSEIAIKRMAKAPD